MALPDVIVDLAAYADLRGLNWENINAAGKGVMQSGEYVYVLEERWEEFYRVAETLAITDAEWEETSAEQARDAWEAVTDEMAERAGNMLDALMAGELSVALDQAATVWTGSIKKLVVATSAVSHRNLTAHMDGTMYYAIDTGETTVEQVEEEASSVARLWDAIVQLDRLDALSALKKPEYGGTAGLGAAAAPAGQALARGLPLVIGAVVVGAVICALLVFLSYLSDRNAQIEKFCFKEDGSPREDRPEWCDQPGQGLPDPLAIFLKPASDFGKRLATFMGIAVLMYAGIYAAPHVVAAYKRSRS